MKLYEYVLQAKDAFSATFKKLQSAAGASEGRVSRVKKGLDDAAKSSDRFNNTLTSLKRTVAGLFAVGALTTFTLGVVNTTAKAEGLRNAINFASGSAKEGAANMAFLERTADRLGTPLEASEQGFKTLSAAMMGSKLQGQATREIFESVSIGAAAMGLTAEQSEGAFLALGQMMGKGKVSAEELRGQLGERIPGAFQIAARAMGVTTMQLDDMLKDGAILSEEFLPKFAAEMKKTFQGALPVATKSLNANLNRMHNQWVLTQRFLGEKFRPVINGTVEALTGLMTWVRSNWSVITGLATAVAYAGGVFLIYRGYVLVSTAATVAYTSATTAARLATVLFTGGFAKLNMVMRLNPVGLIVTAIFALIAGVIYAYNEFEEFRGVVHALWESFKQVFTNIGKFFKQTFEPIFKAIDYFNSGKYKEAAIEAGKFIYNVSPVGLIKNGAEFTLSGNLTQGVGEAWKKGYKKGVEAEGIKLPGWINDMIGGGSDTSGAGVTGEGDVTDSTSLAMDNITGGGNKAMHVEVHVAKFQDKTEIHSATLQEGVDEIEKMFIQMFSRVLNGGINSATQ